MSPQKVALLLLSAAWVLPAGTSEVQSLQNNISAPPQTWLHLSAGRAIPVEHCVRLLPSCLPQRWLHRTIGASPNGTCVGEGNPMLDLASSSVDDLYRGCEYAMMQHLPYLLQKELAMNKKFYLAWDAAKETWMRKHNVNIFPNTMTAFCSVAVVAYTSEKPPLYREFNAATRTGWKGPHAYSSYPFKAWHFLLTQAPKEIWGIKPSCATIYRGTNIMFSICPLFRFGQFTSTSKSSKAAANFGQKTFFVLVSCTGYSLQRLSLYPAEQEVLVPPTEMFQVTQVQQQWQGKIVYARSVGTCSNHNCAYVGKDEDREVGRMMEFHQGVQT